MSPVVKLSLASLIAFSMVPPTSLANPLPASLQANTIQSTQPAKSHQPRPNPDASGKYHIGDGVTPPVLVHAVEPEFAKTVRNNERCLVALTVGTDGKPTDVHIAPSSPVFKNEYNDNLSIETRTICLTAAEQYRFKPATFQGKPVAVDLRVEISFKKNP